MCILTRLASTALFVLGGETVGINDSGAALALPDIAAKRQGLAESEPRLTGKAVLYDSAPENENIDA